jgi:MoxR-like ATPase
MFESVDSIQEALSQQDYIAERSLATSIYLSLRLNKPLFLEGEAGVGKTEIAKVLARLLDTDLIRLQCYEGLDVNTALYEWNYAHQLLNLRLMEASGANREEIRHNLFTREFLQSRPLLQALELSAEGRAPVLLIDELDRADEEFEAFLLELLSDFQVTIPELGTIVADQPPVVIITSNRTREIHDALKRRCLYFWIEYPTFQKELQIVRLKAPDAEPLLVRQVTAFIQEMRRMELFKSPGVAETLDWTTALVALDQHELSPSVVADTIGVVLKYQDDIETVSGETLEALLDRAKVMADM